LPARRPRVRRERQNDDSKDDQGSYHSVLARTQRLIGTVDRFVCASNPVPTVRHRPVVSSEIYQRDEGRRNAGDVQLLRGSRPATIPIRQPSVNEFANFYRRERGLALGVFRP
jgi:hypothetical protein